MLFFIRVVVESTRAVVAKCHFKRVWLKSRRAPRKRDDAARRFTNAFENRGMAAMAGESLPGTPPFIKLINAE